MAKNKITMEEGYRKLYADVFEIKKEDLFSTEDKFSKETNPELYPGGDLKDSIDHCLNEMSEKNKHTVNVVKLAYGLDGLGERTRREIINDLDWHVTTGRVGQVIDKGIRMLRNVTRKKYMMLGTEEFSRQVEELMKSKDTNPDGVNIMMVQEPKERFEIAVKFINDVVNKTSVDDFCNQSNLSVRVYNCLKRSQYCTRTMNALLISGECDLTKLRNCGKKGAEEIKFEIAKWASQYIGNVSYDDLMGILEPIIVSSNMTMTSTVEKAKELYLYNMPISNAAYVSLASGYKCKTLYDIMTLFNDDDKFQRLCNDKPLYDVAMGLAELYCSKLGTDIDTLQNAVKTDVAICTEDDVAKFMCLTTSMRDKLKTMEPFAKYCLDGIKLASVTNRVLYGRLKEFVDALNTTSRFNLYDIFYDIGYMEPSDVTTELHQMLRYYNVYQMEQLIQIHRLFKMRGFDITLTHAAFMWNLYSDSVHSNWVGKEDDESTWLHIITSVIINDKILDKLNA